MEGSENDKQKPGIRWHTTDEEAQETSRQPLGRSQTNASQFSIHTLQSRRSSFDLSTTLPIHYRTV